MTGTASSSSKRMQLPAALFRPIQEHSGEFATEILPAPPTLQSTQQATLRKEPQSKRAPFAVSYLPASDPGSTYTGAAGPLLGMDDSDRRRKRPRLEKSSPSARMQGTPADSHVIPIAAAAGNGHDLSLRPESSSVDGREEGDAKFPTPVEASISRGASPISSADCTTEQALEEDPMSSVNYKRVSNRTKRKSTQIVGEAVQREALDTAARPNDSFNSFPAVVCTLLRHGKQGCSNLICQTNQDHCSACSSVGSLLYCDSCPRAFHLWCLNPPLDHADVPGPESSWHCPGCQLRKDPPPTNPSSFLSDLIYAAQLALPKEFSLPESIRCYFKSVSVGPRGAYQENGLVRPPRINRLGFIEDRDPFRLKDKNGEPVLCFRCGLSSSAAPHAPQSPILPPVNRPRRSTTKPVNYSLSEAEPNRKRILSCDYCTSSWHLDCLSPPLTTMPSRLRKWMCPNHAEQTVANRRQPKLGLRRFEVRETGYLNSGSIEILPSNDAHIRNTVSVDEVLINSRVYRVPERVIILDFWSKVRRSPNGVYGSPNVLLDMGSLSSPLTSLSSFDEGDEEDSNLTRSELDDLSVAEVLCTLGLSGLPWESPAEPKLQMSHQSLGYHESAPTAHDRNLLVVQGEERTEVSVQSGESSSGIDFLKQTSVETRHGYLPLDLIPKSPLTELSSALSPTTSTNDDREEFSSPPLKIRIPKPLNIAVAAATASRSVSNGPRRSLRRSVSKQVNGIDAASDAVIG